MTRVGRVHSRLLEAFLLARTLLAFARGPVEGLLLDPHFALIFFAFALNAHITLLGRRIGNGPSNRRVTCPRPSGKLSFDDCERRADPTPAFPAPPPPSPLPAFPPASYAR